MNQKLLINKIYEYIPNDNNELVEAEYEYSNKSFESVKNRIIGIATVLEEDSDNQIYVISISAGIANMNGALVVVQLEHDKLYFVSYAKEGLIKQHTAEKAIKRIIECL